MDTEKNFEELAKRYSNMIYYHINKLNIRQNQDEYYQIGLIALWDASKTYDNSKGTFSTYLYSCLRGRLLTALNKQVKYQNDEELLEYEEMAITEDPMNEVIFEQMIYSYCDVLTPMQQKWLISYCFDHKTPLEIAASEQVTVASVKSWRRETIKKLRAYYELKSR
ncbi:sigma-70 family RNA polymerase sigma factor [Metabacillus idriensis]|uniref:sigma-70 family RNA polymerase sigma factor n=1 Tax=Metabacillus idriensis TaxID=324768 RepID=UPI00174DD78F|nr:sigma-70 family RNA polymerase sigma factor [Metabacillus idriensis]